jgi:hypothetical protein
MATLAADKVRKFRNLGPAIELPAVASDIVYRGAAGVDSSGNIRPLTAGDAFVGFTDANCDNSTGSAGDKLVSLYTEGEVLLSITGVTSENDLGVTVYASDDDTFLLTASGNSAVGKITQWVTGTQAWVKFQGAAQRSI